MQDTDSDGIKRYILQAEEYLARRQAYRQRVRKMRFDTIAVHGMYSLEEALAGGQGGVIEPLIASTARAYRDSDEMEASLAYRIPAWCYSRFQNPTVFYLEETLALLESYGCAFDASALCTASGIAAIKQAVEPILALNAPNGGIGPINFVSSAQIYGGTFQLFNLRMAERGVRAKWVSQPANLTEWEDLIDEDTRFLYTEMPSNPQQACTDIEAVAKLAHRFGIPLIVDATVATPALLRPLDHGADIIVHSLTKTIGSGGGNIGGAVIARHGVTSRHLADDARADYAGWLKLGAFRDSGPCMAPDTAFRFLGEVRTLRIRMDHFSQNALQVAEFLSLHPKVEQVDYLGLKNHPQHPLASRYMKMADSDKPAFGHLLSFHIRGAAQDARRFFDALERIYRAADLGRIKSVATIPAISTHRQQGEEARKLAGILPTMIRLCVGGEHPDDLLQDLDQALNKV